MGFSKVFGSEPTPPATVTTPPPTVTETQESDTKADYAQRASRKRGLLSTILSNRNRVAGSAGTGGGNRTLG